MATTTPKMPPEKRPEPMPDDGGKPPPPAGSSEEAWATAKVVGFWPGPFDLSYRHVEQLVSRPLWES